MHQSGAEMIGFSDPRGTMSSTIRRSSLHVGYVSLFVALGCAQSGNNPNGGASTNPGGAGGATTTKTGSGNSGGQVELGENTGAVGGCGGTCSTAVISTAIGYCGDGIINQAGEVCDDGNALGGDGCTAICDQIEVGFACPTPGLACQSNVRCGDSLVGGTETCDFGARGPNEACNAACQLQPGWDCPVPGLACFAAKCGDGIIAGAEECEFTTATPPDGCTSCRIAQTYDCTFADSNSTCWKTVCGDKKTERGEQCDDGNRLPFDGCYNCRKEPSCANGACAASCGDGQRFDTEACDDGNTKSGDGCSSTCTIETGFTCSDMTLDPPTVLTTPVLLRDFVGRGNALNGMAVHNDFNVGFVCAVVGAVEKTLNPTNGRPVFNCPGGVCSKNPASSGCYQTSWDTNNKTTLFDQWYTNVDGVNIPLVKEIPLARQANGTYKYDSANTATGIFDLIGAEGWVALNQENLACSAPTRNVSFTSETHFWFQYQGGEQFVFSGDDDTWVFVNNTLVIDLGGTHGRREGRFTLDADTDGVDGPDSADGTAVWVSPDTSCGYCGNGVYPTTDQNVALGLTAGGIYEVVVFQAERNQCESNFGITMSNFSKAKSFCEAACGDGIVASTELCDDGTNTSTYNGCGAGCTLVPYCGDGEVQSAHEACDDGVNTSLYGGCAPGCVKGPSCGDGLVQSPYEACDDGINDGGYKECAANCRYAEFCGDGKTQSAYEECDNGASNGDSACSKNCLLTATQ